MSDETIFYIVGGVLAASALVVTFLGLKMEKFPGRALPLVVIWFAVLAVGATTYSVFQAQEHEAAHAEELHEAGEHIEETEGAPHENEGGAQGGESEELEEEAEEEAEGSEEEEPVGESEGNKEASGGDAAAGASVFAEHCAGCHGEDGHGGPGGPDLTTMPLAQTESGAVQQVTNGGGGMPPFGEELSKEEISDVAAFVVQDVVGK
jgi:cytochrome c551